MKRAALVVFAFFLAACTDADNYTSDYTLVFHEDLSIGSADGGDAYLFSRIDDITIGTDGRIYVLTSRVGPIRVFDPDGAFLFEFGVDGQGPGELQYANTIVALSDRIVVWDRIKRGALHYSLDGEYQDMQRHDIGTPYGFQAFGDSIVFAVVAAIEGNAASDQRLFISEKTFKEFRLIDGGTLHNPDDKLEARLGNAPGFFALAVIDSTLIVIPRMVYRCAVTWIDLKDNASIIGPGRHKKVGYDRCEDPPYRLITETEYDAVRAESPMGLSATYGQGESVFARHAQTAGMPFPIGNGHVALIVDRYAHGNRRSADLFDSSGAFEYSVTVSGLNETARLMTWDDRGRLYFRGRSAEGVPLVVRYTYELENFP